MRCSTVVRRNFAVTIPELFPRIAEEVGLKHRAATDGVQSVGTGNVLNCTLDTPWNAKLASRTLCAVKGEA